MFVIYAAKRKAFILSQYSKDLSQTISLFIEICKNVAIPNKFLLLANYVLYITNNQHLATYFSKKFWY